MNSMPWNNEEKNESNTKRNIEDKRRRIRIVVIVTGILWFSVLMYGMSQNMKLHVWEEKYSKLEESKNTELQKCSKKYNDLEEKYSELEESKKKLQEDYDELQNLPDIAVYADIEGKDIQLQLYSTVEAARRNIKYLEYERLRLADVRLIFSEHNKKKIKDIRISRGSIVKEVYLGNLKDEAQVDNTSSVLDTYSIEGEEYLLSILYGNTKIYTAYCPVEKED